MRTTTRGALALALGAALLAGCGGDDLSEGAAATLQEEVANLRAAAASGDRADASQHLENLRAQVDELLRRGELSEARATEILAAATAVEEQLGILEPPPTDAETEDDDEDDDDDEGKGRGRNGGKKGKSDD